MNGSVSIASEDKDFCHLIVAVVFSNPFNPGRAALLGRLLEKNGELDSREVVDLLRELLSARMERWEREAAADWRRYRAEDQQVMRVVLLFDCYHRYFHQLDALIEDQERAGDESLPVAFAHDAMALLGRRGFSVEESRRYFALFFQLRRAHHFIDRGLVGECPCMVTLRRHLWDNVFTSDILQYDRLFLGRMEDFSTLLLGETGTGKGVAAAAIGRSGYMPFAARKGRLAESFMAARVATNLSQLNELLIESELFGYRKGAFTGATENYGGVLSMCSPRGAVFLDEIGEVSVPVQIKLLRVLQERRYNPVGSREEKLFRGRVIAATNQSLESLRREGGFRSDFYFRLCSDSITVPSLRQRIAESPDELDRMVSHLCRRIAGGEEGGLAAAVVDRVRSDVGLGYDWPGNVRELEQAIRRVVIAGSYEGVSGPSSPDENLLKGIESGSLTAEALLSGYCSLLYRRESSYESVARRTALDRRTAKKYVLME